MAGSPLRYLPQIFLDIFPIEDLQVLLGGAKEILSWRQI